MVDSPGYLATYLSTISGTEQTEVRSAILTLLGAAAIATLLGNAAVQSGDRGDIVVSGSTWSIDAMAVTYSKIQDVTSGRVLGRKTAGAGQVEELTTSDLKTLLAYGTAADKLVGTGAGQVPVLDGSGLLDVSIIPAVAITDTFVVSSQVAMLALTAEKGDIAIRDDVNKTFVLSSNSPSTLADWKELLSPTGAVVSVAGLSGTISASALRTALTLDSASSPQFVGIEIGHASDTTITRSGAGIIAVEGVEVPTISSAHTLTNKRITHRVGSTASGATITADSDAYDQYNVTALAVAATIAAPSGTPTDGQDLFFRFKDNGTARGLTWNAIFRAVSVILPTTTVINKVLYAWARYNAADTKWDVILVRQE